MASTHEFGWWLARTKDSRRCSHGCATPSPPHTCCCEEGDQDLAVLLAGQQVVTNSVPTSLLPLTRGAAARRERDLRRAFSPLIPGAFLRPSFDYEINAQ